MQFRSVGHATTAASTSEAYQSQLRVSLAALKAGSARRFRLTRFSMARSASETSSALVESDTPLLTCLASRRLLLVAPYMTLPASL